MITSMPRGRGVFCLKLTVMAWEAMTVQFISLHTSYPQHHTSTHTHLPLILDGSNNRWVRPPVSGSGRNDVPIAQVEAAILEEI